MSLTGMITDRTIEDVSRVEALARKIEAGTASAAERAEFSTPMKGAYNAADRNRVGAAVYALAGRLEKEAGISVPIVAKQDWADNEAVTASEARGYINDIIAVRSALPAVDYTPQPPRQYERLTYNTANDIERILLATEAQIERIGEARRYAGEVFSGEA